MVFERCLALVLKREAGFVNNVHDRGGMTNLGVTRKTLEAWLHRDVTEAEMRGLTQAKVAPIYRSNYWNVVQGEALPPPLALCVFDFAVNAGPRRAIKYLQTMVGADNDGAMGPRTREMVQAYVAAHGVAEAVRSYQGLRRTYYRQCDDFIHFGKGWLNRVNDVETDALRWCP